MIVRTLCISKSFIEWEERLRDEISAVTGDDSTLVMAVYGWESFSSLQSAFMERELVLKSQLDQELSVDELRAMWQSYKIGYELNTENAAIDEC